MNTEPVTYDGNPSTAKLNNLNFYSLEVVDRYRDPQLQASENYSYLYDLRSNICKSWCLNTHFFPNNGYLISANKTDQKRLLSSLEVQPLQRGHRL